MATELKQRIVGGIVIACVLAIFLPILLHKPKNEPAESLPLSIPKPAVVSEMSLQLPAQASDQQQSVSVAAVPATATTAAAAAHVAISEQSVLKSSGSSAVTGPTALKFTPEPVPVPEPMPAPKPIPVPVPKPKPVPVPKPIPAPPIPARVTMTHSPDLDNVQLVSMSSAWVVQLGSFSQEKNADALVKQLHLHGFAAYARHDAAAHITRVFVGPSRARHDSEMVNKKLQQAFHLKGVVRKDTV